MSGRISREPLFSDADQREISDYLALLQQEASKAIEKSPAHRDQILKKVEQMSRDYVSTKIHQRRKFNFFAYLVLAALSFLLIWLGDAIGVRLVMAFGACGVISFLVTALLNIPLRSR